MGMSLLTVETAQAGVSEESSGVRHRQGGTALQTTDHTHTHSTKPNMTNSYMSQLQQDANCKGDVLLA